jgi:hypothetical protein
MHMGKYLQGKFGDLLTYATFASLLFYILTIIGVLSYVKKRYRTSLFLAISSDLQWSRSNLYYFIGL